MSTSKGYPSFNEIEILRFANALDELKLFSMFTQAYKLIIDRIFTILTLVE